MAFLKVKNRAISTLASGVSDVATEWTLATGEGALFPSSGDFHVTCENEIVKCTSRTGDVLTVVREQEGTTKAAHDADKAVKLRITAGVIENIEDEITGIAPSKARAYRDGDWYLSSGAWLRVPLNATSFDALSELNVTSKLGTASATTANHLIDTTLSQFTAGDLGKWVYNSTDKTYAIVTAYNSSSDLTLDTDIMASGEAYELYAGTFKATIAGWYQYNGVVRCNWTLADKWYFGGVAKNGTVIASGGWQASVGDGADTNCISGVVADIVHLDIDDELSLVAYHNEGDTAKFRGSGDQTFLSVHILSRGS